MKKDVKSFMETFGFAKSETVRVNAERLKEVLKENETLKKNNEELATIAETQSKEIERLLKREEYLLNENDKLYSNLNLCMNRKDELNRVLDNTRKTLNDASRRAKDSEALKEKLALSNALSSYRAEQLKMERLTADYEVII